MEKLTILNFRKINSARSVKWHKGETWNLHEWLTALIGEFGETSNIVKKLNRHRKNMVGNKDDFHTLKQKLKDEIIDTYCYWDLVCEQADYSIDYQFDGFIENSLNVITNKEYDPNKNITKMGKYLGRLCDILDHNDLTNKNSPHYKKYLEDFQRNLLLFLEQLMILSAYADVDWNVDLPRKFNEVSDRNGFDIKI